MSRRVYIIAGPNGAGSPRGKILANYADCKNFINADLIGQGMSRMLEEIERYAERGESFGFETTLSGPSHLSMIRCLKKRGCEVHSFYLRAPGVHLALTRVRARVLEGGHDVPESVVRRR